MHGTEAPSPWIQRWGHLLTPACSALDIACGGGRHMQWLAAQGHAVLGVDRSAEALQAAQAALALDFQPLSDLRATAAYRIEVAQALMQRLWLSMQGDAAGHLADKVASAIEHEALRLEVWR